MALKKNHINSSQLRACHFFRGVAWPKVVELAGFFFPARGLGLEGSKASSSSAGKWVVP